MKITNRFHIGRFHNFTRFQTFYVHMDKRRSLYLLGKIVFTLYDEKQDYSKSNWLPIGSKEYFEAKERENEL